MVLRWFLVYVIVELAVVVGLSYAIGFGWTVLVLLGALLLGLSLAGSQLKRQLRRLTAGLEDPRGAAADGALVALGTVLVVVPGLVTTALGVLLLLPPTRAAARPVFARLVARRAARITVSAGGRDWPGRGDYIDGEVIEVIDAEPVIDAEQSPLPARPVAPPTR